MDRWENKTPEERAQIQKRQKEIADRWSKQQAQKKSQILNLHLRENVSANVDEIILMVKVDRGKDHTEIDFYEY